MTERNEDIAIMFCERPNEVNVVLRPIYKERGLTDFKSRDGFVLDQLVWDRTHQCIGQIMAFYDDGEIRLDSDGCVSLEDIEPLRECHFAKSKRLSPSLVLRMALTIQELQQQGGSNES